MSNKIFLITILFISGCSSIQIVGDKIINRDGNFSVTKIDSNWQLNIKRSDILVKKINVISFIYGDFDGEIFIVSRRLTGEEKMKKIEAFVPEMIIELKKTNTIQNWSAKKSIFNDLEAIEIIYDGYYKGKDIIFKKDRHLYIIRFLIKPELYEYGGKYYERLAESFTFTDFAE